MYHVTSYWTCSAKDRRTRSVLPRDQLLSEAICDIPGMWRALRCCSWSRLATRRRHLTCEPFLSLPLETMDGLEIIPIHPFSCRFLLPASPDPFVILSVLMSCRQARAFVELQRSWKKKVFCLLEWSSPQGNRKAELVPFTLLNGDRFVFSTGGPYTYTVGLFSTHYKPSKSASFQASVAAWSLQYLRRVGIFQLADRCRGFTKWKGRSELQQWNHIL